MQLVIPEKNKFKNFTGEQRTAVEQAYARMKAKELDIRPLGNADKDVQGAYNLDSGIIKLGTYEKTTPRVLWHEHMHKILKESLGLERGAEDNPLKTTIQWDNIANSLEEFLFPDEKMPHHEVNYAEALKLKSKEKDLGDLLKRSFR